MQQVGQHNLELGPGESLLQDVLRRLAIKSTERVDNALALGGQHDMHFAASPSQNLFNFRVERRRAQHRRRWRRVLARPHQMNGLTDRQANSRLLPEPGNNADVAFGIQTLVAGGSERGWHAISTLPCPKRICWDSGAADDCP